MNRRPSFAPALPLLVIPLLLPLSSCGPNNSNAKAQAAARAACEFAAGALPAKTLANTDPVGNKIPIDHIVMIMQENRSFDAYFSKLTVPGQTVEAASDTATNPDLNSQNVSRFHWSSATATNGNPNGLDYYCFADPEHGWDGTHVEYDDGKLDGFIKANNNPTRPDGSGNRAMGYYDESDIPYYYALARAFAISDHHFCSLLGPTWPNRMFFMGATSYGLTGNIPVPEQANGEPYPNIFSRLNDAKVSWKVYFLDLPSPAIFADTYATNMEHFAPATEYYTDAANGTLPSVSIVEGSDSGKGNLTLPDNSSLTAVDEHPPQDMQLGQKLVASVVGALMHSPNWAHSAFILTYDEHGGEYDHVVPPPACKPDDLPLHFTPGDSTVAAFDRYGFRTPLIVVSPYAKRGYVSHTVVDYTSITRFLETRFNLPALTARDANAWPLLDMFDFSHANTALPDLPTASIDPGQQAQCHTDYPPSSSGF